MPRVPFVPRARYDQNVRPQLPDMLDDIVDDARGVDGDDDSRAWRDAGLEKTRIGRVAVINVVIVAASRVTVRARNRRQYKECRSASRVHKRLYHAP